jgi:ParB family chromosome partitioning protein
LIYSIGKNKFMNDINIQTTPSSNLNNEQNLPSILPSQTLATVSDNSTIVLPASEPMFIMDPVSSPTDTLSVPTPQNTVVTEAVVSTPLTTLSVVDSPLSGLSVPNMEPDRLSYADAKIQEIELAKIVANPFQPRKVFKPEALKELADSIKEHGVIQPLVVTITPSGYELVVGERRFRASQLAGLIKVPAIIKQSMVDQTKLEVALIENIQRQELNPIEEAQAYDRLMKTFNMTQDQVAKKVGKSRPAVANTVRLLNLPAEVQRGVIEGKITEGHARALLGLSDPEKILLMYRVVLEQNLNVRQVETKVRELTVKRQMDSIAPDPKLMAMESELRGKLGTQVKIRRQGQGGSITIEFFSDEELSELIQKMADQRSAEQGGYLTV